jgi:hypothetical protein
MDGTRGRCLDLCDGQRQGITPADRACLEESNATPYLVLSRPDDDFSKPPAPPSPGRRSSLSQHTSAGYAPWSMRFMEPYHVLQPLRP